VTTITIWPVNHRWPSTGCPHVVLADFEAPPRIFGPTAWKGVLPIKKLQAKAEQIAFAL
jgi:hypothetical protein